LTKTKSIILGVSGGIAIYKVLDLISNLKKLGHKINVVMTQNATRFIQPVTFHAISQNHAFTDTFENAMTHIKLADEADIFIIAPATYNIIGKIANGIADDLLSTIASAVTCRKLIAPAMNVHMYENKILQKNLNILKENGYEIIEPESGFLACGYEGMGRLRNVEDILNIILKNDHANINLLKGKKVLVTAGGTREMIDPVRYIGNMSSGKMGIRFAEAARDHGADVTLVYCQVKTHLPKGIKLIKADNTNDLLRILEDEISGINLLIMAAAVSDYRVSEISNVKIKKKDSLTLNLIKTHDILRSLNNKKENGQIFVGFAAESNNVIDNAKSKLKDKNLDLIIANDISKNNIGFDSDENEVSVIFPNDNNIKIPRMDKYLLSCEIIKIIHKHFFTN